MSDNVFLRCIRPACGATYAVTAGQYRCLKCNALLDVGYDWDRLEPPESLSFFEGRWATRNQPLDLSGVWRFRELLPFAPADCLVTLGEGQTILQSADVKALDLPLKPNCLHFQYEGMNPSGSFKDNGMAAAITMAHLMGRRRVCCASTGNTSASMALYAAHTRRSDGTPMQAIVFIGTGKIAYGKLAQALDYGARTLQIDGDFDTCLKRIFEAADRLGLYPMNSVNPFRHEGQKTIMYRVLEGLGWQVPDWIVLPGGNLGNTSAFGKAFIELKELGLISRLPRLAVVNAEGANTLYELVTRRGLRWNQGDWDESLPAALYQEMDAAGQKANTIASAIEIARPVNLPKALRSLAATDGVVAQVSDDQILDEKARIGRCGLGCEPASAASLAGLRQLLTQGMIGKNDRVVCILTGHALKDPGATVRYHTGLSTEMPQNRTPQPVGPWANQPIPVANDLDAICDVIESLV